LRIKELQTYAALRSIMKAMFACTNMS
jgi:hypothetical protein